MTYQQLQALFPQWELVFLDPKWDTALVGVVVRANTPPLPAYSWLKCLESAMDVEALNELFIERKLLQPLILMPIQRSDFWKKVEQRELVIWEQCHPAITALGRRGFEPPVVVYSYPELLDCLTSAMEPSDERTTIAQSIFEANIAPTWLGPHTPFVLYPVGEIQAEKEV
jgi:hypothetical protein